MLTEGDKAPNFSILDDKGNKVQLKDFKGKTLVLYFYPKASTPGCTIESEAFRDAKAKFTVIKDQSGPNKYLIEADGYPDELVSITDTAPASVDTSFTRVFPNYTGGRISIKKLSGSRAAAIGVAIIDLRCSE